MNDGINEWMIEGHCDSLLDKVSRQKPIHATNKVGCAH